MTPRTLSRRCSAAAALFPIATSRFGRSSKINSNNNSSPALLSLALCDRLVNGSSASCGCSGKTFQRKTASSICDKTSQMTAAVRSAIASPRVGRGAETPQRSAWDRYAHHRSTLDQCVVLLDNRDHDQPRSHQLRRAQPPQECLSVLAPAGLVHPHSQKHRTDANTD